MVLNILIPLRKWYRLQNLITEKHLDNMGKVMLAMGLTVAYGYIFDMFTSWYSGDSAEQYSLPLFWAALSINLGMWIERFIIVIVSLSRDYLPSSWRLFIPTGWDWLTLFGSLGLFFGLVFLFVRFLPMVTMFEIRELVSERTEGPR